MKNLSGFMIKLAAGLAVVASYLLLIIELNANTRSTLYEIEMDRISRIRDAADSEYIPAIVARIKQRDAAYIEPATAALIETYDLSFEEADRFSRHLAGIWEGLQADFRYGVRDVIYVQELLTYPDQDLYWEQSKHGYDKCFARWVEEIRAGRTPPPPTARDQLTRWFIPYRPQDGNSKSCARV